MRYESIQVKYVGQPRHRNISTVPLFRCNLGHCVLNRVQIFCRGIHTYMMLTSLNLTPLYSERTAILVGYTW